MSDRACYKTSTQSQLVSCKSASFTCCSFINSRYLEQHVARKNNRNPEFWRTLAFTHSGFRRTGSHGLVWENADKYLAFTLEESVDGNTASLNLVVFDPTAIKRLQTKFTEVKLIATRCSACATATLGFAMFYSAG